MNTSTPVHAFLLSALLAGSSLAQIQVTLGSARDNTLYQDATGSLSNGAGSYFFAGQTLNNAARRGLLRFNVAASVPAGSTILSADLTLDLSQAQLPAVMVSLHRVSADWGEGTSQALSGEGGGAAATTNDATWINRFHPGNPWTNQGGDFPATPSGSQMVGNTFGPYTWASTTAMVADVQGWLDNPATNFGWLVKGDETAASTAKRFGTKEHATPGARPRLVLTIRPPAARVVSTGIGCGIVPFVATAQGLPSLGNASFAIRGSGGPASGLSLLFLSPLLAAVPIPLGGGCFLYLDPVTGLFLLDAQPFISGVANHALPIPVDLTLVGIGLPTQLFAIDLTNPSAIRSSNALSLFLGS